jgi:hypothetical protein
MKQTRFEKAYQAYVMAMIKAKRVREITSFSYWMHEWFPSVDIS